MKKNIYIKFFFAFIGIIFLFTTISMATVTITDDNLNEALTALATYLDSDEFEIVSEAADGTFAIIYDEMEYNVEYDITDTSTSTFTYKMDIYQGMSYDDYSNITSNGGSGVICEFLIAAYTQGIEFDDSNSYFTMTFLLNALSGTTSTTSGYTIYDDTDLDEGVTIIKDESDTSILYVSDFDEWIMDYTNSLYGDTTTVADSDEGYGLYEMTISQEDVTDTSCSIVYTLTVNIGEDFSQIDGFYDLLISEYDDFDASAYDIDYTVELVEGQKCIINTSEDITGYYLKATDLDGDISISTDYTTITAVSAGNLIYDFYIGDETYTIYFVITEGSGEDYDDVTLTISGSSGGSNTNTSSTNTTNSTSNNTTNNTTVSSLPYTGYSNIIILFIVGGVILGIVFKIQLKKYNDI